MNFEILFIKILKVSREENGKEVKKNKVMAFPIKDVYDKYILNKFKHDSLCLEFGEMVGIDFSEKEYESEVEKFVHKYNYEKDYIKANFSYIAFKYGMAEKKVTDFLFDFFKKDNVNLIEE